MKMKTLTVAFVAAIPVLCLAQTKIQCQQGPDGRMYAAQIWQNTLGVSRANELCAAAARSASSPTTSSEASGRFDDGTYARAVQQGAASGVQLEGRETKRPSPQVKTDEVLEIPVGYERVW